ncbi:MAG: aminomethyltransferase family protein [Desulforhopalus sp.]
MDATKRTVLHDWHVENGANMALFANYDMPLWYKTGVKAEHLAVIRGAGIFDTSHMAVVSVTGEGARALLQYCLSKDLDSCLGKGKTELVNGRCVYGVFLNPDGTVIDDAIVYQLQPTSFMVVVNAGMGGEIAAHLQKNIGEVAVTVEDLTGRVGKMDIQGPDSARVLKKILKDPQAVFDRMVYFSFKGGVGELQTSVPVECIDGTPMLLSRTGYTGEFGFELFVAVEKLASLWTMVLEAGKESGVIACGLAARDSLRAGAVLPLSHQDIGPWPFLNNPWPFALPFNDDNTSFSKEFIGKTALLQEKWNKYTLPFAGYDPRKIAADDESFVISSTGERLGTILTCTTDMAIGRMDGEIVSVAGDKDFQAKGLCCGFVLLDRNHSPGEQVILSDGKRKIKVEIRADIRPGRTARNSIGAMLA